jgi:hypothetical protein
VKVPLAAIPEPEYAQFHTIAAFAVRPEPAITTTAVSIRIDRNSMEIMAEITTLFI